jgi:branched-chain amino acid transport system permease protein
MSGFASGALFIALYGISYGMILFIISLGMVVTMGLMRVLNLAHGAFAAGGGYIAVMLMNRYDVPFALAVALAVCGMGALGAICERLFYARLYSARILDQMLMTIGLAFIAVATLNLVFGPNPVMAHLPPLLSTDIDIAGQPLQVYRIMIIAVGLALIALLWLVFDYTDFGALLRAAVDNRGMAQAVGIDVDRLYMVAFAFGTGLAALGGALGYTILPLEPLYPFKYLTIVPIVVAMAGRGNLKSSAAVAVIVGIVDTACRYLLPSVGAYVVYFLLLGSLFWRRAGFLPAGAS